MMFLEHIDQFSACCFVQAGLPKTMAHMRNIKEMLNIPTGGRWVTDEFDVHLHSLICNLNSI